MTFLTPSEVRNQFVTRPPLLRLLPDELIVDSFAGGGGASTGIELALRARGAGRAVLKCPNARANLTTGAANDR